jgi:hypothetical protein
MVLEMLTTVFWRRMEDEKVLGGRERTGEGVSQRKLGADSDKYIHACQMLSNSCSDRIRVVFPAIAFRSPDIPSNKSIENNMKCKVLLTHGRSGI